MCNGFLLDSFIMVEVTNGICKDFKYKLLINYILFYNKD